MAFQTGTATDIGDLLDTIYTFAVANSWVDLGSSPWISSPSTSQVGDAHRYWRILSTETQGDDQLEIGEMEFRATAGGGDVTGSGTAFASSSFGTSNLPQEAFANNGTTTRWLSADEGVGAFLPIWLAYDFGAGNDTAVREISIQNLTANDTQAPRSFRIQWSDDGVSWYTEWEVLNESAWGAGETRVYTNPTAAGTAYGFRSTDTDSYINLQGPGVDSAQRSFAFIGYQPTADGSLYSLRLWSYTAFQSANAAAPQSQPGAVGPSFMNGLGPGNSVEYWLSVSDRRIMCVCRFGSIYTGFYLGFFLPFAATTEYLFPILVQGDFGSQTTSDSIDSGHRMFTRPGSDTGLLRLWDGNTEDIRCHLTGGSGSEPATLPTGYMWPAHSGVSTNSGSENWPGGTTSGTPMLSRFDATAQGDLPMWPAHLALANSINGFYGHIGALEGAYVPAGDGLVAEQAIVIGTVQATGTLTTTANLANNDTITIGATTYTLKTALTPAANEVLIGASASDTLDNLVAAINGEAGSGTTYGAGTTANASVRASRPTATTLACVARTFGTAGNSVATTETSSNASFGGATLAGGVSRNFRAFPDISRTTTADWTIIEEV